MKPRTKKGRGNHAYVDAIVEVGADAALTANGHTPMAIYLVKTKSGLSKDTEDKHKHGVVIGICLSHCTEPQRQLVEKFISELDAIDQQQS